MEFLSWLRNYLITCFIKCRHSFIKKRYFIAFSVAEAFYFKILQERDLDESNEWMVLIKGQWKGSRVKKESLLKMEPVESSH